MGCTRLASTGTSSLQGKSSRRMTRCMGIGRTTPRSRSSTIGVYLHLQPVSQTAVAGVDAPFALKQGRARDITSHIVILHIVALRGVSVASTLFTIDLGLYLGEWRVAWRWRVPTGEHDAWIAGSDDHLQPQPLTAVAGAVAARAFESAVAFQASSRTAMRSSSGFACTSSRRLLEKRMACHGRFRARR